MCAEIISQLRIPDILSINKITFDFGSPVANLFHVCTRSERCNLVTYLYQAIN